MAELALKEAVREGNEMKKLLASLLCVAMIVCFMPTMAFAAEDGSGTGEETSATKVAKVGETEYATLQEAVNVAENNATITLLQNTTEDITILEGKKVTLNLNGKTLTNSSKDTITVANGAELTIEGTGTVDNVTHAKAALVNYGIAVLKGGTYTRSKENSENNKNSAVGNSFYTRDRKSVV